MADTGTPSRVAFWLSSARSVALAGETANAMRGAWGGRVDDAGLGRAVGRRHDLPEEALDRRRADDRAAAAREQRRDGGAHAVEDAGQHDPEALLPHLGLDLRHVAAAAHRRVV